MAALILDSLPTDAKIVRLHVPWDFFKRRVLSGVDGRREGQTRNDAKQIQIAGLLSYVPAGRVLAGALGHDPKSLSAFVERGDLLTLKKS